MSYVPLWVKSNYSFLEGASHPDELVTQAAELGLPALALTDRDGVYGIVRAHVAALAGKKQLTQQATRLLYGSEVSVCAILPEGERLDPATASAATVATPVLLAQSRAGYGRLCTLLSLGRRRCDKGAALVTLDEPNLLPIFHAKHVSTASLFSRNSLHLCHRYRSLRIARLSAP